MRILLAQHSLLQVPDVLASVCSPGKLLLSVYVAEGQNTLGEFRESTPYLWVAEMKA
jgi:hypothetical protein